jgi:hypothetical protein
MTGAARANRSFIVECFVPGVDAAAVTVASQRAAEVAAGLRAEGRQVHYEGALLIPGDEVVFHRFRATSMAVVRTAAERASLPFERVLETMSIGAGAASPPEPGESKRLV